MEDHLRKEKTKSMNQMEELSSSSHFTLDKVADTIQSEQMWKDFSKVARKCRKDLPVSKREVDIPIIMEFKLIQVNCCSKVSADISFKNYATFSNL